jgi:hypothetical protein
VENISLASSQSPLQAFSSLNGMWSYSKGLRQDPHGFLVFVRFGKTATVPVRKLC